MRKIKNIIYFVMFMSFFILLFSNNSYAMSQSLNSLNFDINIMDNGDVLITEIWDADLYDTNTLFKTFTRDSKFKEISDVSVVEIDKDGNLIKNYYNSGTYNYHEKKGYFHATNDEHEDFEIAWGVSANGTEHRYFKISYMIEDCINVYNDCAEFYWKIIGEKWELSIGSITGTVVLPNEVLDLNDFKVWAHGPLNGEIHKLDSRTCYFKIDNMPTQTFLELRLVFPTNIVNKDGQKNKIDKLLEILAEEQKNADNANNLRKRAKIISEIGIAVIFITSGLFAFFSIKKLFELKKEYDNFEIFKGKIKISYFRDIPNSNMDPTEAAYFVLNKVPEKNIINSLFMSLAYKKVIYIKTGNNKEDTEIIINKDYEDNNNLKLLTEGERHLLGYIDSIGKKFSIKKFEDYINKHAESFYNVIDRIKTCSKNNLRNNYKYIDERLEELKLKIKERANICFFNMFIYFLVICLFLGVFLIDSLDSMFDKVSFIIIAIEFMYLFSVLYLLSLKNKINIYTEIGTEEYAKWQGFIKFLKTFSLIDEREIPELVLWEQYLVYATGFGIAKRVLKQLKSKFPQLSDAEYYNDYSCFYIASNNMFSHFINNSVSKAISAHNIKVSGSSYSSGSGGGGGFSSGGGGGRRRRPVAAEDSREYLLKFKNKNHIEILYIIMWFYYFKIKVSII